MKSAVINKVIGFGLGLGIALFVGILYTLPTVAVEAQEAQESAIVAETTESSEEESADEASEATETETETEEEAPAQESAVSGGATVDEPAELEVKVNVINNEGGTKTEGDFTVTVSGVSPSPSSFPGSFAGTVVSLMPGSYQAQIASYTGYTIQYSPQCEGKLKSGEGKNCVILLKDEPTDIVTTGSLLFKVHVINNDGGTKQASDIGINIFNSDASPASFVGSEAGTSVTLNIGSWSYSVENHDGYELSFSPSCNDAITVGGNNECVVTLDDIDQNIPGGNLHVIVKVVNDNGGTKVSSDFTVVVEPGTTPSIASFPGSATGTNVFLGLGVYGLSLLDHQGYDVSISGTDCATVMADGDDRTCVITLNDAPGEVLGGNLHVFVNVVNNNGGTKSASDFSITINPGNNPSIPTFIGSTSGTHIFLGVGYYGLSLPNHNGYSVAVSGIDCATLMSDGDDRTCTITLDDIDPELPGGNLHVIVNVINDNGGTKVSSDFTVSIFPGNNPSLASFPGSASGTDIFLGVGYYGLSLPSHAGYSVTTSGTDCSTLMNDGDDKTCTITYNDIGDNTGPTNTAPVITLIGSSTVSLTKGTVFVDLGATSTDAEDGTLTPVVSGSVDTATVGTYVLTYSVTDSGGLSASVTRTVNVTASQNDGVITNGGDDDNSNNNGGENGGDDDDNDNDDDDDDNSSRNRNRRGGRGGSGEVLGASTSVGGSCSIYLISYIGIGRNNNVEDVIRLQNFLNSYLGLNLSVNGVYDTATVAAVNALQEKEWETILAPWGPHGLENIRKGTSYVYKTTSWFVNTKQNGCANLPFPLLP